MVFCWWYTIPIFNCLIGILNFLSKRFFRKSSIICMISKNFNLKCGIRYFKGWFSCIVIPIRFSYAKSLKRSTVTWVAQLHMIVSLPENCGTNTGRADWNWSSETADPGLFSVSFLMDPDFFPFVIHCSIFDIPNIHGAQRCTSPFMYRNIDDMTPIFSILNMDLRWRWDKFSCQYLNSCFKVDNTYGNMILLICSCVRLYDSFIKSSEEIETNPMCDIFPDLRNSLVIAILFTCKKLRLYFILSRSLVFISTISTISLCTSFFILESHLF